MRLRWLRRLRTTLLALALGAWAPEVAAQEPAAPGERQGAEALSGRTLTKIDVIVQGERWREPVTLHRVRPGQIFSPELARVAMQELLDSGRFADVRAFVEPSGAGVLLRLEVLPRRVVANISLRGSPIDAEELIGNSGLASGREVSAPALPEARERMLRTLRERGYPDATVTLQVTDTDDPLAVVIGIDVIAGSGLKIAERWFEVWPDPEAPGLRQLLSSYAVAEGALGDESRLASADRELSRLLVERGFHEAVVSHRLERKDRVARLTVVVHAGPLIVLSFEGNRSFDESQLLAALDLEDSDERSPLILVEQLRTFYVERGFFDAEIDYEHRGGSDATIRSLVFRVLERPQLKVVAREYPCLSGERNPGAVGSEIDSFLAELPGGELVSAVDEEAVNELYGPTEGAGRRKRPLSLTPWTAYVPEVYDKAIEHLQNLYRSEGYLSAIVGPVAIMRRACDRRSPAGQCIPVGPRRRPRTECRYDEIGLPLEEPPIEPELTCKPDPKRGLSCEPEVVLHLPIKIGPRTYLQDVVFEGNRTLAEQALSQAAELEPGAPVSQAMLENARRRILDAYSEEGFAFAEADSALDLSFDHSRARARFVISERDRVKVSRIVIRGARITSESLIRGRVALEEGAYYRRSLVRKTEERLATLGVFSTVTVGFEDPYVPAREKVVVITVEERKPQRLDVRPGFSTGEGFRISFEYGHNNLGGQAIGFTARTQLAYLPMALIFEDDVRRKLQTVDAVDRIERRNTLGLEFPEIGLGPLFRLSVEAVDLHDITRDYGLTKDAGIVTLMFRPDLRVSTQFGVSVELNNVAVFGLDEQRQSLADYLTENAGERNKFRIPEGETVVMAPRVGVTWDRRDNPLDATSGTFVSLGAEYVCAFPLESATDASGNEIPRSLDSTACPKPVPRDATDPFAPRESKFMRYTNRIAGYMRLNKRGLSLAASFRWGLIQQLRPDSRTYPDRLFFMGGVDSIRGFPQDSLVPEDIAQLILNPPDPTAALTIDEVLIRGGDVMLNPRGELRVPLTGGVQTALFVDSGNLWATPSEIGQQFRFRYSVGTGIRVGTPIGPLVFDYGFNVDRVLDALIPSRPNQRYWEDLGAFHFSIGLY